jgi:DNA polymerase elongation subunit (family B)
VIAANGVAFTAPNVRQGVLPRLLQEILETRVMVKGAMKGTKRDRVLQRCLNARQFALKLISNVTYGYTAAGVSTRAMYAATALCCICILINGARSRHHVDCSEGCGQCYRILRADAIC